MLGLAGGMSAPASRPGVGDWVSTQPNSPVLPGAHLVKLAGGFSFTEGPTSDDAGNVYFVDQPNNSILKWAVDGAGGGKLSVWMKPSGYSNGMCFDGAGNLIACADGRNELWSIAPDKTVTVLVRGFEGKLLNGPNDVWVRPDGGMYITDPHYKRPWWPSSRPAGVQTKVEGRAVEGVYYLSPDRKTLTRVIDDFEKPNGLIGTPDGKVLYASDIQGGKTFSYTIHADGSLGDKKLFNTFGSDGMTIDSEGNIYITCNGAVQICSRAGELLDTIPVPAANCCFGGADGRTLFLTARGSFYSLRMKTHRVGPQ